MATCIMKRTQLRISMAGLAVTTASAIYQAFYVAPNHSNHLDNIDKKMDILYSRNGMMVMNPNKYDNY